MSDQGADRWLVTINGRVVTDDDMRQHRQGLLALALAADGFTQRGGLSRSEFVKDAAAYGFCRETAREFPEDDVRLWASVDTTSQPDRKVETA